MTRDQPADHEHPMPHAKNGESNDARNTAGSAVGCACASAAGRQAGSPALAAPLASWSIEDETIESASAPCYLAEFHTMNQPKSMNRIEGVHREVIEKSEWVAIATAGPDGPHLAACWTRNVLALGIDEDEILLPAWRYEKTAENLSQDPRVELLFVAREVPHSEGQGQGCSVVGTGELQISGPKAERVKARFPWSRGALVVNVTGLRTHLP